LISIYPVRNNTPLEFLRGFTQLIACVTLNISSVKNSCIHGLAPFTSSKDLWGLQYCNLRNCFQQFLILLAKFKSFWARICSRFTAELNVATSRPIHFPRSPSLPPQFHIRPSLKMRFITEPQMRRRLDHKPRSVIPTKQWTLLIITHLAGTRPVKPNHRNPHRLGAICHNPVSRCKNGCLHLLRDHQVQCIKGP